MVIVKDDVKNVPLTPNEEVICFYMCKCLGLKLSNFNRMDMFYMIGLMAAKSIDCSTEFMHMGDENLSQRENEC